MRMKTKALGLWVALLVLILGVGMSLYQVLNSPRPPEYADQLAAGIVLLPQRREIPNLSFITHQQQPLQTADLKGHWSLVFFGYSFCPDICPTTLSDLRRLYQQLPQATREQLRVFLVTVDPQRDTPEQLEGYLKYFSPDFTGLTGDLADIQRLSAVLGIPFIPGDTGKPGYTVDHSANLALIDPEGYARGFVRAPIRLEPLVKQLPTLMSHP
ncbi:SCO family protein [Azomonas agilis]|nr:SCO family protein [Azomonas agilis]